MTWEYLIKNIFNEKKGSRKYNKDICNVQIRAGNVCGANCNRPIE